MNPKTTLTLTLCLFVLTVIGQQTNHFKSHQNEEDLFETNLESLEYQLQNKATTNGSLANKSIKYSKTEGSKNIENTSLLDSVVSYYFSSEIDSIPSGKTVYVYEAGNDQAIEKVTYNWDSNLDVWGVVRKSEYDYDVYKNEEAHFFWDATISEWVGDFKREYYLDDNQNHTSVVWSNWDANTRDWLVSSKYDSTFDANNNIISSISSGWDSTLNDWSLNTKTEYVYNANNDVVQRSLYNWDSDTNIWDVYTRKEYDYDNRGNAILIVTYDFNFNNWYGYVKEEYAFDMNNNMISELRHYWNYDFNDWELQRSKVYTYDADGNIMQEIRYRLDPSTGTFVETYRWDTHYDIEDIVVVESYFWDSNISAWVLTRKEFSYYSKKNALSTKTDSAIAGVILYPNPTSDFVTIKTNTNTASVTLDLFDLSGRKIYHSEEINKALNLKSVPSGQYIYRLKINDQQKTGKLIKR
ncbi:T9SS type A sorting domain-containing protein [Pseudotamlana agarivorans]|uniref:T9SS type A sorting domain-containing protein n=1 Tax=Pseudotamlana agarivorans TaxID=481183 RepID=UPI00082B0BE8|nr:T9SS type A sorting domain-containing protein [Tamlana agarivorans]